MPETVTGEGLRHHPYFKLWEINPNTSRTFEVFQSVIAHNRGFMVCVRQRLSEGVLVGQYTLFKEDCLLRLAKSPAVVIEEPVNSNGVVKDQLRLF